MKITLRQILIVIAVLAVIVVNSLANIIPFNGQTTGQVSENLSNYFVPAGYVFSIWGLIYLGLVAYAIFQVRPVETKNPHLKAISGWFLLSSAANIVWLLLWHYNQFILTVPVMLVLLFSLIKIYLILHKGNSQVSTRPPWSP
jgi:benzodiazapine receptor